ncbi:MAG: adenosylmethionine--8-amino-7-oxononanoate transaminase [Puia sp.]|nr:adenosylmethionine--8-amino-7-oxononanoate transaminase [Puia sp.]
MNSSHPEPGIKPINQPAKQTLTERDSQVIWHPYTQHKNMLSPVPVIQGKGSLLFDDQGQGYIDAISSWWVNIHGHAHPYIAEKIYEQARKLEHVIFTGFTHEPAVRLAERLLEILPGDFSRIFYSDNGSTAVEAAIKMAIQYWRIQSKPRNKILAFRHSYHGDTFGAMSVSERSLFTAAFWDHLFEVVFIDTPTEENYLETIEQVRRLSGQIACFIYEPLLQAAGGMRIYEAGPMDRLLEAVRSEGILCIADEVLTGFGRTGRLFASEYLQNRSDIICLSKGLTGGTMALGVTACTPRVFEAFLSDDKTNTFFHGHSFTANPLACSASLASLDLLEVPACRERIGEIGLKHGEFAKRIAKYPSVRNARSIGTIVAFEVNTGRDEYINEVGATITRDSMRHGIYLRPLGNTVYIMPPYCITNPELDKVYEFLEGCIGHQFSQPLSDLKTTE